LVCVTSILSPTAKRRYFTWILRPATYCSMEVERWSKSQILVYRGSWTQIILTNILLMTPTPSV
ncbi:hypothetical protein BAE44_0001728, partial [Dichanthelium oligosanthes]